MPEVIDTDTQNYAIIVAGGTGTRMQNAIPKQFLFLNGKAVLMHTIEAFWQSSFKPLIIVVLPYNYHEYWNTLCLKNNFNIPHLLITGGSTRFHSVQNALATIPETNRSLIAVQDAVRPLTSKQIIEDSYQIAAKLGNAITAVKSRDSVRSLSNGSSKSISRENVFLVQTPQTFQLSQIKKAYEQQPEPDFTDDATVVEKAGFQINIVEGSYTNIKITYPEDLCIAEAIIKTGL